MLIALHGRLGHDPATEREVVRDELGKIVRLRLAKAFGCRLRLAEGHNQRR